jgi:hypothetical protein
MRFARAAVAAFTCVVSAIPLFGQVPASTDTQASLLLQHAHAVLASATPVTDVALTGTVRRIAGSDDETGSVTIKALATGESSAEFSFSSGVRREVRSSISGKPEGRWSGPDGVLHVMAEHNLKVEGAWFSPVLLVRRVVTSPNKVLRYLGSETVEGQTLEHVRVADRNPVIPDKAPPQIAQLVQHLTEMDLFLDPATSLPAKITFNEHPDNDASRDIPVEIRFSDYRVANGVQIPFHVKKFFNGSLMLDLQVDSAALNSGLPASTFSLQ